MLLLLTPWRHLSVARPPHQTGSAAAARTVGDNRPTTPVGSTSSSPVLPLGGDGHHTTDYRYPGHRSLTGSEISQIFASGVGDDGGDRSKNRNTHTPHD